MKKVEILLFVLLIPLLLLDQIESKVSFFIPVIIYFSAQGLIWVNFLSKKFEFSKSFFISMIFTLEFADLCEGTMKTIFMSISIIQMIIAIYFFYKDYINNN